MAKHDAQDIFNMLNTQSTDITQSTDNTQKKVGRPPKEETKIRYNLVLDNETKTYLKNKAWQDRKSVSQYIVDLVKEDMKKYFDNGGTMEGWID